MNISHSWLIFVVLGLGALGGCKQNAPTIPLDKSETTRAVSHALPSLSYRDRQLACFDISRSGLKHVDLKRAEDDRLNAYLLSCALMPILLEVDAKPADYDAAWAEKSAAIDALVMRSLDLNFRDQYGGTLIDYVASAKIEIDTKKALISKWLSNGQALNTTNIMGLGPLDYIDETDPLYKILATEGFSKHDKPNQNLEKLRILEFSFSCSEAADGYLRSEEKTMATDDDELNAYFLACSLDPVLQDENPEEDRAARLAELQARKQAQADIFLARELDENYRGPYGETLLMYVAVSRQPGSWKLDAARVLLDKGVDPKARTYFGETASDMALTVGDNQLVALLDKL